MSSGVQVSEILIGTPKEGMHFSSSHFLSIISILFLACSLIGYSNWKLLSHVNLLVPPHTVQTLSSPLNHLLHFLVPSNLLTPRLLSKLIYTMPSMKSRPKIPLWIPYILLVTSGLKRGNASSKRRKNERKRRLAMPARHRREAKPPPPLPTPANPRTPAFTPLSPLQRTTPVAPLQWLLELPPRRLSLRRASASDSSLLQLLHLNQLHPSRVPQVRLCTVFHSSSTTPAFLQLHSLLDPPCLH
jgi:hypothetical protein